MRGFGSVDTVLFDAHGPDHGLKVSLDGRSVTVEQWAELCEPDENGSYSPHITSASMSLAECLEHAAKDGRHNDSQRQRVISGALHYLSYRGGEEDHLSDDDTPCRHFDGECSVCVPFKAGDSVVVGQHEGAFGPTYLPTIESVKILPESGLTQIKTTDGRVYIGDGETSSIYTQGPSVVCLQSTCPGMRTETGIG